jgi:hypothetical protein
MQRIVLAALVTGLGSMLFLGSSGQAQDEARAATISGSVIPDQLAAPVASGSVLRVTSPGLEICAEVPVGPDLAFRGSIASTNGHGCRLAPGDGLGFWLIRPDGSVELLSPVGGQQPVWAPGANLRVDLGAVPCPEPCLPPEVAGPPDPELLPTTGVGNSGGWELRWKAPLVAALVAPAIIAVVYIGRRKASA